MRRVGSRGYPPCAIGALAATVLSACAAGPGPDLDDLVDLDDEIALAAMSSGEPDASARFEPPSPGAAGIGDELYPTLGNGGYDALHYALALRYETSDPAQPIDGTVTIIARATQSLSQFDLDFAGDSIGAVRVNGFPAAVVRDGEDLVITPARPIRRGQPFVVTVTHFAATPAAPIPGVFDSAPFFSAPAGNGWALQPNNAHRVFPCNDHPSDKASFSFRIDVPEGITAVTSGVQRSVHTVHGRTIYRSEQREPMATELAQVAVGTYAVIARGSHAGVILRDVVPAPLATDLAPKLAIAADQIDAMVNTVGEYPFSAYGSFVVDAPVGFALETQTLSVYDRRFFDAPQTSFAPTMVHELAHQWFGNSVSPSRWSDVWQSEGHATWYELSARFGLDSPQLTELLKNAYGNGDLFRGFFGPVARPPSGELLTLFNPNVYIGGALALYALRQQIGDPAFRAVERAWVTTFRGRSASTEDFIALASRVAGQDLTEFLRDWLFGTKTPAMPGHPDWAVLPFPPAAPSSSFTAIDPELALPPELRGPFLRP